MASRSPDAWRRVRDTFDVAIALSADQRERYLSGLPDEVREEAAALLAAHDRAQTVFDTPARDPLDVGAAIVDLTGARLGPYEVAARIGSGGMGDVFRACDSRLDRTVAIKVLPSRTPDDEAARGRFEREARAVAALNHPHICTLHDIGTATRPDGHGSVHYLVMEFIDGETLAAALARERLPVARAHEYAVQIASALRAAHTAGIVHRDLKPGNIMLTPAGAKLLDFGLAKAPRHVSAGALAVAGSDVTALGTVVGTLRYMSPEQLRGEAADARADLYAFGCVLYEMVTGRKVFEGDAADSIRQRRAASAPPPTLDRVALSAAGLDEIVMKCLAPSAAERWQTADDLLRALKDVAGRATTARQNVDGRSLVTRQRRRIVAAALAATALVAGLWSLASRQGGGNAAEALRTAQLAVVPLRTIGETAAGDEYLGVGIADSIITRLATVRDIGLRPTTAVLGYANAAFAPTQVANALAADYVLTGTIQRGSSSYRVTMQLVEGETNAVTWARTYDVVRSGLRDLQDSVAEQVVDVLRVQLAPDERERLRPHYTPKAAAYDHYLEGRASLLNYTEAGMKQAIASFERALAIDPDYALARASLAVGEAWFSIRYAYETDARTWGARADREARIALAADPDLAEAKLAMAGAAGTLYGGFTWPTVIDDARRALEIDPTLELAHVVLMRAYFHFGLFDQMLAEAEAAHRMNPLGNVEVARLEVAASLFSGAYDRARDQASALLARSDAPVIRNYLGLAQFYTGDVSSARRTLAAVTRNGRPDVRSQAALASVEAAAGARDEARMRAMTIARGPYMDHHVAYSLGATWAQLGEPATAIKWLREAADTGFPCLLSIERDPLLDPLRQQTDFKTFLQELRGRFDRDAARYRRAA